MWVASQKICLNKFVTGEYLPVVTKKAVEGEQASF